MTLLISHPGTTLPIEITATRRVAAPPERVFAFLRDLENHWLLTGRAVSIDELDGPVGARTGGRVRLRGPLFARRRVRTRVLESRAPGWMMGRAEIGRRTIALISWTIAGEPRGSRVQLKAEVGGLGTLDRLLLTFGGRRWMRRLFEAALTALAESLAPQAATPAIPAPRPPAPEPALAWEGQ